MKIMLVEDDPSLSGVIAFTLRRAGFEVMPASARLATLAVWQKVLPGLVMVTHDIEQARRLADYVMFMWLGELVEQAPAAQFFSQPKEELTQAYLARRIG